VRLDDFRGKSAPGRPGRSLPDPGAGSHDDQPGRCAQLAPRTGGTTQEPGTIRPAPSPGDFPAALPARPPDTALFGMAELAEATGIARQTLWEWLDTGQLVPGRPHPDDARKTNCYTGPEIAAIIESLAEADLIIMRGGKYIKTKITPGTTRLAALLIERFNALWAQSADRDEHNIQGQGDIRAVMLPEVDVYQIPGGETLIKVPVPAEEPFQHAADVRGWNRPARPDTAPSRRSRPRRRQGR
jgi:hypothetical protein